MTTVRDIIAAAHRKIAVLAQGESMPADMASGGLFAYNAMMHGFKAQGADLSHTDAHLSDDFSLNDEFIEGAIYMLAARLSPDYRVPAHFDESVWRTALTAANASIPVMTVPVALTRPPSRDDREGNLPLTN